MSWVSMGFDVGGTYTHKISAGAFTWGYNIDFLETEFDPSDGIDGDEVALAGHEVVHTAQYRNDSKFTAKYLLNYASNLADNALFKSVTQLWAMGSAGIGQNAYLNINYEKEARAMQNDIRKDIKKDGNPCNPVSINGRKYNH